MELVSTSGRQLERWQLPLRGDDKLPLSRRYLRWRGGRHRCLIRGTRFPSAREAESSGFPDTNVTRHGIRVDGRQRACPNRGGRCSRVLPRPGCVVVCDRGMADRMARRRRECTRRSRSLRSSQCIAHPDASPTAHGARTGIGTSRQRTGCSRAWSASCAPRTPASVPSVFPLARWVLVQRPGAVAFGRGSSDSGQNGLQNDRR